MDEKRMLLHKIIMIKSVICCLESRSITYEHNLKLIKEYKKNINDEILRISKIAVSEKDMILIKNDDIKKKKENYIKICKELEKRKKLLDNPKMIADEIKGTFLVETQKNIDMTLEKCNNYIDFADDYIKKNDDYKKRIDNMLNETIGSLKKLNYKVDTIIDCHRKIQENERKKTNLIYDKLCSDNLDFIHYKDFDKLDYIYFYIETNRADNIRDALNLVDNQIRHEELIGVLNEAISTICTTISKEGIRICDAIGQFSDRICQEINNGINSLKEDNQRIIDSLESIDVNILSISNNVGKIVDNQTLANSLLENQNKSCADMLKHYRYVNGMSGDI